VRAGKAPPSNKAPSSKKGDPKAALFSNIVLN